MTKRKRTKVQPRARRALWDGSVRDIQIAAWELGGRALPAVHPGKLLWEEFMKPYQVTPEMLAAAIPRDPELPDSDLADDIRDLILADDDSCLDLRLALALDRYFGLRPGFFWRVQAEHEIRDWLRQEQGWLALVKPYRTGKPAERPANRRTASSAAPRGTNSAIDRKRKLSALLRKITSRNLHEDAWKDKTGREPKRLPK